MSHKDPKTRFEFGKNWQQFLKHLDEERIRNSVNDLSQMIGTTDLKGKSFLDIGSGSGLSSLAAKRMGAKVHSFDYDLNSVNCTKYLKEKFYKDDSNWTVEQGSVLDDNYLRGLGEFDIVYSWGVLHHTGHMMQALENVNVNVKDNGKLFIAIYNDQQTRSKMWKSIKSAYVKSPKIIKLFLLGFCYIIIWGKIFLYDLLFRFNPFHTWNSTKKDRGMSPHYDLIDWVGGYPFEVATPELIFNFYRKKNYVLEKLTTSGKGHGCNQFVFTKKAQS